MTSICFMNACIVWFCYLISCVILTLQCINPFLTSANARNMFSRPVYMCLWWFVCVSDYAMWRGLWLSWWIGREGMWYVMTSSSRSQSWSTGCLLIETGILLQCSSKIVGHCCETNLCVFLDFACLLINTFMNTNFTVCPVLTYYGLFRLFILCSITMNVLLSNK